MWRSRMRCSGCVTLPLNRHLMIASVFGGALEDGAVRPPKKEHVSQVSGVVTPHNGQFSIGAICTGVSLERGVPPDFLFHQSINRVRQFMEPPDGSAPSSPPYQGGVLLLNDRGVEPLDRVELSPSVYETDARPMSYSGVSWRKSNTTRAVLQLLPRWRATIWVDPQTDEELPRLTLWV